MKRRSSARRLVWGLFFTIVVLSLSVSTLTEGGLVPSTPAFGQSHGAHQQQVAVETANHLLSLSGPTVLFADSFQSGDTSEWSDTAP